jgi:hypothetical protein
MHNLLPVYFYSHYQPGGHLNYKILRAWSFYNLMEIAEY